MEQHKFNPRELYKYKSSCFATVLLTTITVWLVAKLSAEQTTTYIAASVGLRSSELRFVFRTYSLSTTWTPRDGEGYNSHAVKILRTSEVCSRCTEYRFNFTLIRSAEPNNFTLIEPKSRLSSTLVRGPVPNKFTLISSADPNITVPIESKLEFDCVSKNSTEENSVVLENCKGNFTVDHQNGSISTLKTRKSFYAVTERAGSRFELSVCTGETKVLGFARPDYKKRIMLLLWEIASELWHAIPMLKQDFFDTENLSQTAAVSIAKEHPECWSPTHEEGSLGSLVNV